MARLVYVVTALALGALVSGFFVDTSNIPLFASIGLSGVVVLLVLFGWSRRIRSGLDLEAPSEAQIDEMSLVVLDDLEVEADDEEHRGHREDPGRSDDEAELTVVTRPAASRRAGTRQAPVKKPRPVKAAAPKKGGARVLVIPGRARYHQPGCRFARSDAVREVSEATAKRRGYQPCTVCSG